MPHDASRRRRRIAIIGGGIGGLALAAALDPRRCEVTVYEAAPGRARFGGGLGLWPSAQRALRTLGAWDSIADSGARMPSGAMRHIDGRVLVTSHAMPVVFVPRPVLHAALLARVPASVTVVEREVRDPASVDADWVVGADGVRSVVRAMVSAAAAERVETPWVALRGVLPREPDPADAGEYWGDGLLFGVAPGGGGRGYWFTTHRSDLGPEPLSVDATLAEARVAFAGAAPIVRETLDAAGAGDVGAVGAPTSAVRLWVAPPMTRYVRGRFVVLGDAAHAMTPNLGRGACDAIVDAVTLARALQSSRPGAALLAWQARRLPVTQGARAASGLVMRTALGPLPTRVAALRR